jgi:site-specific DNA-methyltransferase (adenine-specific)
MTVMSALDDHSIDIIVTDPPYALGSEVIICKDGKPDYRKATDFMNKWDMPTGVWWEKWYAEALRVLKHGGYCLMFGIDRQLLMFKYYAALAGFEERQSLYWYFTSNYPKSTDLGKMIDRQAGAVREVTGDHPMQHLNGRQPMTLSGKYKFSPLSKPATDLAKKYNGYRYSISALKQTNETIMVFQKPYKTGSCLHDTLAYEHGDASCCCGAVNAAERVGTGQITVRGGTRGVINGQSIPRPTNAVNAPHTGRYPAQTFVDSGAADVLDRQSGVTVTKARERDTSPSNANPTISFGKFYKCGEAYDDVCGASGILHTCDFEKGEYDIYYHCSKVGVTERCKGVSHPTIKPLKLMSHILRLFRTPNPQLLLDPFAGSGTTLLAAKELGYAYIGVELSAEYCRMITQRLNELMPLQRSIPAASVKSPASRSLID